MNCNNGSSFLFKYFHSIYYGKGTLKCSEVADCTHWSSSLLAWCRSDERSILTSWTNSSSEEREAKPLIATSHDHRALINSDSFELHLTVSWPWTTLVMCGRTFPGRHYTHLSWPKAPPGGLAGVLLSLSLSLLCRLFWWKRFLAFTASAEPWSGWL